MLQVVNRDTYAIKRFLFQNKGIVVPFSKLGVHPVLKIEMAKLNKCLKTLVSKKYVEKIGNWQHAWYFVTEDGQKKLKEEVEKPIEGEKKNFTILSIKQTETYQLRTILTFVLYIVFVACCLKI
ncbi:uncharacterized protein VICG_00819 [Vittaforma corneae ATCC 50505]|uniref:Plectin/eS10 N-terminal domain-containing protein n=1 Tax=Vittaforma corneae (strain ATCC 50505) TaxID=993615 RepID=L2GMX8_VITCO|nr:uncharacterized protein VICG_00819 [Vittaforma corneae ATCC 50505]ELA42176.1 hypothetical protein VICG_00819 [Vittaforma corneae ATCC 50505]